MGWELRKGRWYLYRNRRVNGTPVKEYLAAEGDWGCVMAHTLHRLQRRERKVRRLTRNAVADYRRRIDQLLTEVRAADVTLRTVAEGLLHAAGFHRHNRGEWRMRRELKKLAERIEQLQAQTLALKPRPLVRYDAPADDAEAVEVFAQARSGNAAAIDRVYAMIREKKWVGWIGDLGRQATHQLVHTAASGDEVWKAGIAEKAEQLRRSLLGPDPTALDEILVRRVVNNWVAVHALELEQTVRPPLDPRALAYLDRRLTQAQRRLTDASRALAAVRRAVTPRVAVRALNAIVNA